LEPKRIIRKNARDSMQAQVESFLVEKIDTDVWAVGAKIPSERELAEELEVSRITVRNAVLALTNRGIFERSVAQGTFVRRTGGRKAETRTAGGGVSPAARTRPDCGRERSARARLGPSAISGLGAGNA